jgi:hypothetical protein
MAYFNLLNGDTAYQGGGPAGKKVPRPQESQYPLSPRSPLPSQVIQQTLIGQRPWLLTLTGQGVDRDHPKLYEKLTSAAWSRATLRLGSFEPLCVA